MSEISAISEWIDKTGSSVQMSEFFLDKTKYRGFYENAVNRGETPIEQLSPKGLALLSFLYSERDQSAMQPVIASTTTDFKHAVGLIADAAVGTKLTVILQLTDWSHPIIDPTSMVHKTVCQLERTETGVQCIHMDSIGGYSVPCDALLKGALKDKGVKYTFYQQKEPILKSPESEEFKQLARQNDAYQCGVFAFKDARHLGRDKDFLKNNPLTPDPYLENYYQYEMPPLYLKGMQSRTYSRQVLGTYGDTVVTRKGRTLREVHEKHDVTGYIQHFSQKYHDLVEKFVNDNIDDPDKIREAVKKYNAGALTPEQLAEIYGPKIAATDENKSTLPPVRSNSPDSKNMPLQVEEAENASPHAETPAANIPFKAEQENIKHTLKLRREEYLSKTSIKAVETNTRQSVQESEEQDVSKSGMSNK